MFVVKNYSLFKSLNSFLKYQIYYLNQISSKKKNRKSRTFIGIKIKNVEYSLTLRFRLFIFSQKDNNNAFIFMLKIVILIFCRSSENNTHI